MRSEECFISMNLMEGLFAILVWDRKVFFFLLVQIQNYLYEAATKLCF